MDLRVIEREVVDQHHRSFRVWRRPQSAIVWGAFRVLGQVSREFQSPAAPDASLIDLWRVFDQFKRGAAQVVRWVAESDVMECDWLPENEQILDETLDLLNWAVDYARLACALHRLDTQGDQRGCRKQYCAASDSRSLAMLPSLSLPPI